MVVRNHFNYTMKLTLNKEIIEINIKLAMLLWFRDVMFTYFRQDIGCRISMISKNY